MILSFSAKDDSLEKEEGRGPAATDRRSKGTRPSIAEKSKAGLHLQKVWPTTKQGNWPFTVFRPNILPERGGSDSERSVAQIKGRRKKSEEKTIVNSCIYCNIDGCKFVNMGVKTEKY